MASIFRLSFEVVFPILILIALGYFLRRIHIIPETMVKPMNRLVFRLLIPCSLFCSMIDSDFSTGLDGYAILYAVVSIVVLFVFLMLVVPRVIKERPVAASVVQAIYRSNFGLLGLSIAGSLCSPDEFKNVASMLAIIVPTFNVLAVICFETLCGTKIKLRNVLKNIATNPLIVSAVLGVLCSVSRLAIPELLLSPVRQLSASATPIGLIVLGACFSFREAMESHLLVSVTTLLRLLAVPAVFLTIACLLGIRGGSLIGLLGMYASPCAMASAPMAFEMGGDGKLSGQLVATTCVLCPLTLFIIITALQYFSML